MADIRDNLERVRERIVSACQRAGRDPGEVVLVCVSKTQPENAVLEAIEAGATDLGENYVQEARSKIKAIGRPVRWHMIGGLQSNKAAVAAELFDMVQTVDGAKLAGRLDRSAGDVKKRLDVLVEVNVAGEASKSGVLPEETPSLVEDIRRMSNLRLLGIMGIPPIADSEAEARGYFRRLREVFEGLPADNRKVLSMGMSGDFEEAILEGSTLVRVGTAIFGPRRYIAAS